ncbi:hypothetical protein ACJ41O_009752 [Fusarium nematophilum]
MSQKSKNGNIMSFFKPVARPQTPQASQQTSMTTPVKQKTPLAPDREIRASDEDDDFGSSSDDSLEDLSAILGRGRPGNAARSPPKNPFATPKAKRTAVEFHSSPLAIIPKHKFDLKALAKDARQDDATHASSIRAKALSELVDEADMMDTDEPSRHVMEGIVKNNTGQDAQKVLRAVQRSEPGQSQLRYCFFRDDYTVPSPKAAPRKFSKGHWRLLTQGDQQAREQHLASGLPLTLLTMLGALPDELFEWILDDLCAQKSSLVREEYCNLLSASSEQVERLVSPMRLEELFYRYGASSDLASRDSELKQSKLGADPYEGRDWSGICSFLCLIYAMAPSMSSESVVYAAQTLLRMSMDKSLIYNIDLMVAFQEAIWAVLEAIPQPNWDSFCHETCSLLHTLFKVQYVRTTALMCLPLAFLFDDPGLGRYRPDDIVTISIIIDCLRGDDFSVGPKTDFAALKASIILLNIVVDDGSFTASDDPEEEKQFNNEIDDLTALLGDIWRKINDSGMKLARTEAKSVIEWVQQRLAHSVRTRRKAKKSVFELSSQRQDLSLPRQQDYMKNFLRKAQENPKEDTLEKAEEKAEETGAGTVQETGPEQTSPSVDEDTIVVKVK